MDMHTSAFRCEHCGATYVPQLPAAINMFVAMSNEFVKAHRGCKKPVTVQHLPADDSEGGLP